MRRNSLLTALAVLALALLVAPTFARPFSRIVSLSVPGKIGGTLLAPGDYQLTVQGSVVVVVHDHKVVARTEGRWQFGREHYSATAILSDVATGQIREIRFEGSNRALVFSNAS